MTVCNVNFARVFSENPQSSSPMQTNPRLTRQLEITNLHVRLLHDPDKVARKTSDLNFLFYFRDIFDDYFRKVLFYLVLNLNRQSITLNFCHLDNNSRFIENTRNYIVPCCRYVFQIPYSLSYSIAFPMICQDFTSGLNRMCPEEFDITIADIR